MNASCAGSIARNSQYTPLSRPGGFWPEN